MTSRVLAVPDENRQRGIFPILPVNVPRFYLARLFFLFFPLSVFDCLSLLLPALILIHIFSHELKRILCAWVSHTFTNFLRSTSLFNWRVQVMSALVWYFIWYYEHACKLYSCTCTAQDKNVQVNIMKRTYNFEKKIPNYKNTKQTRGPWATSLTWEKSSKQSTYMILL